MTPAPTHHARVFGSPWEGVYGTLMQSARHFGKHWHAVYGLGMLEDGAQSSASGRGKVEAYAGDLITTNPGEVHDGQPLGGPSRRWRMVYLEPAVMATMAADSPGAPARPVIQDAALSQALQVLLRRLAQWDARRHTANADALACEESLVQTCALLLQGHAHADAQAHADSRVLANAQVKRVRDRLADDPLEPPSLTDLAVMTGLSKFQVLRRFEQAYGVTPHAWLLQQRAERARRLILGGASLAQAAATCGFADQSHMTRIFARHFGFTPGACQRAAHSSARR